MLCMVCAANAARTLVLQYRPPSGCDPQGARADELGPQQTKGHPHGTQQLEHIEHHAIQMGTHTEETRLGLGHAGLDLLGLHLGLVCVELSPGAFKSALADVLILKKQFLPCHSLAGHTQASLCDFEMGGVADHVFLCSAVVDAQQLLPRPTT
jgi:hypothetical protein